MGHLDAAARAYRDALAGHQESKTAAAAMVQAAAQRAEAARIALAEAIVAAAKAGTPQVEIIRVTGYARETIRTIERRGGVLRE